MDKIKILNQSKALITESLKDSDTVLYANGETIVATGNKNKLLLSVGLVIYKMLLEQIISPEELDILINAIKEYVAKEMIDNLMNRNDN